MAMIQCPECGKEISDKANSCPNCGYGIRKGKRIGKLPVIVGIIVVIIVSLCVFFSGNRVNKKYVSLEDEVIDRSLLLQEQYGKISNDIAEAFCDGEKKYLILYYRGVGRESQNLGNTYCIYITDKDGKTEIIDPNGDYDDLSVSFMEVQEAMYSDSFNEYRSKNMEISYEEYNNFVEGYLPACLASNDKLREDD